MQSSNDRIEELADKVKALGNKVEKSSKMAVKYNFLLNSTFDNYSS